MTADIQRQIAAAKANTAPPSARTPSPKGKTQPAVVGERTDELEAQSEKRKDYNQRRAEAELSRLNQQESPRYQTGKGESTLGTVRFFHLQPAELDQLIAYATSTLGAKPA
jgi:hypothetical protein